MNGQEALRLALSPEERQRLDTDRLKALSVRVKACMESEASHGFNEGDWIRYVFLRDEYGPLYADLPAPVNGGETQGPLRPLRALAMALGASILGEYAYLTLGVLPTVTVKATHPGGLLTDCMEDEPTLKPTHAEKVVVAQLYYDKGLRVGAEEERARIVALWDEIVSRMHVEAGPVEAALIAFSREAFLPTTPVRR